MDPLVPLSYVNQLANTTVNYGLIGVIVILVFSGAFFSGVETALTCCNRAETALTTTNKVRLRMLVEEGNKQAIILDKILGNSRKMLSTILIGNNVLRIASASIASILATQLLPGNATLADTLATVIMTLIVFMFGEVIPKNFCKANADRMVQPNELMIAIKEQ